MAETKLLECRVYVNAVVPRTSHSNLKAAATNFIAHRQFGPLEISNEGRMKKWVVQPRQHCHLLILLNDGQGFNSDAFRSRSHKSQAETR